MALRNRVPISNLINQENVKSENPQKIPLKEVITKRPALGDLGNKVNTSRGAKPILRSSLLPKEKSKSSKAIVNNKLPLEKIKEKVPAPIVKAVVKETTINDINAPPSILVINKEPESFSTDLLGIEDIDKEDRNNPNLLPDYSNDIYNYLRQLEQAYPIEKEFLKAQEITPKMRSILIDWIIEVHQQFRLLQETLYLTVAIIDRFLQSFRKIDKKRLQLVGVSAMFIACKYEEMYAPDINDFAYVSVNAYSRREILQMEMLIMKTLDYSIGRPLPLHFLRRYSQAGKASPVHHTLAKYFMEQCLLSYEMSHHHPSLISAAALYLSFLIIGNQDDDIGKPVWTNTLAYYSTYGKEQVIPLVCEIAAIILNAEKSKYQAVRNKYLLSKNMRVSARPELKSPIVKVLGSMNTEKEN